MVEDKKLLKAKQNKQRKKVRKVKVLDELYLKPE